MHHGRQRVYLAKLFEQYLTAVENSREYSLRGLLGRDPTCPYTITKVSAENFISLRTWGQKCNPINISCELLDVEKAYLVRTLIRNENLRIQISIKWETTCWTTLDFISHNSLPALQ